MSIKSVKEDISSRTQSQQQDSTFDETNIFNLGADYFKSLLYFESSSRIDEGIIKEAILNEVKGCYILHGDHRLLLVINDHNDTTKIDLLLNPFQLIKKKIPFINENPFILSCEINETQFKHINPDKNLAIKLIESKTGLKLKKQKKRFFFTGLLFQFMILNDMLSQRSTSESSDYSSDTERSNWRESFQSSSIKSLFTIKPKQDNIKFQFEVYIFQSDITELDVDCLITDVACYTGDGVFKRIREKAGKQMQDACKLILRQNELIDGQVFITKSFGKLKSKNVLHSISPSWSSLIRNQLDPDKFESNLELTFNNIIKLSNDSNARSIAIPVEATGAFDIPLDLCVHTLYTSLVNFYLSTDADQTVNTICLTSNDQETVKIIRDMFENYSECYAESSWAIPLSPFERLFYEDRKKCETEGRMLVSVKSNNERLISVNSVKQVKNVRDENNFKASCLICQRENRRELIGCGNEDCITVYCKQCLAVYLKNQEARKCPSCRKTISDQVCMKIRLSNERSSSPSPARFNSIQNNVYQNRKISSGQIMKSQAKLNVKYAIDDAKIYIRKLDEPCDGYEMFKSLLVTFEIEDGFQNESHPKPGVPYKGTQKRAYLPEIPEHREILAFYERALKTGRLFKIAYNRNFDDYRVHLNQDVLLKTNQHGGGRFGYPDREYIGNLLQMARSFK